VIEVTGVGEDGGVQPGDTLVCAEALLADMTAKAGIAKYEVKARLKGTVLAGTVLAHAESLAGGALVTTPD